MIRGIGSKLIISIFIINKIDIILNVSQFLANTHQFNTNIKRSFYNQHNRHSLKNPLKFNPHSIKILSQNCLGFFI